MRWFVVALALLVPATAHASRVQLTADQKLREWVSPEGWSAETAIRADVVRHGHRLGVHPHTDGCSATYSGRGVFAVLSVCGRHLRLKFISVDDHRRRFHLTYQGEAEDHA